MSNSIALLLQRIAALDQKIADKEDEATMTETELTGGNKAAVSKWRNQVAELEQQLEKLQLDTKPTVTPQPGATAPTSTPSPLREAHMDMARDVASQPMLDPSIDVAVFTRRMNVCFNTHCKKEPRLVPDFLRQVEQRLSPDYRHSFQLNTQDKAISTWPQMEEYLLSCHKSNTTVFQELQKLESLTMGRDELLRDFSARIKSCGGDAYTIIKSKFRDEYKRELTLDDFMEIYKSSIMIKQMQQHHVYSGFYDQIVKDLDHVYKVEDVASKASIFADRQVRSQSTVSSAGNVYVASQSTDDRINRLETTLQSALQCFAAGQKPQTSGTASSSQSDKSQGSKKKRKPWKELIKDPKFMEHAKTKPCHKERDNGNCDRETCPFKHSRPHGPTQKSSMFNAIDSSSFP